MTAPRVMRAVIAFVLLAVGTLVVRKHLLEMNEHLDKSPRFSDITPTSIPVTAGR